MTKVHCHLCGARLRRPEEFRERARPDRNDVTYLCRDETRCATRATFELRDRTSQHTRPVVSRGNPNAMLRTPDTTRVPAAVLEPAEGRKRAPLGAGLTPAETEPIRVHQKDGGWQVDYGSYAQGYHHSRDEAIEKATTYAARENRELTIEDAHTTD